jgi:2-haloacid dehalogenase
VIETLFPLDPLRQRIVVAGQPGHVLELWFARLLRDAFALVATDGYRLFPEVAANALSSATGQALTGDAVRGIVAGFAELEPHPHVGPAMHRARESGIRVIRLINGSAQITDTLLRRAGVREHVEQVLSVDPMRRWKPAPEIYRHATHTCKCRRIGWRWSRRTAGTPTAPQCWTGHRVVSRLEGRHPDLFDPADVTGDDLVSVVDGLLALPAN